MRRWPLLAVLINYATCATGNPVEIFEQANEAFSESPRRALSLYDRVAKHPRSSEPEKLSALLRAADACDQLKDVHCAITRLEEACQLNLPGMVEPAQFALAEHVKEADPARALNLYYRAASGAQKNRGDGFPYKESLHRIMQLRGKAPEPDKKDAVPGNDVEEK